jgi:hypothetical protein
LAGAIFMNRIGICGDNCEYCPRYIATQSGRIEDLEKVKELWVRLGLRTPDFPGKDMTCHGCKPENKCAYTELRACVSTIMVDNCGLCDEYPCKLINSVFHKSEKLKDRVNNVCTLEEKDTLYKAFFLKREYFDQIYQKHLKKLK